MISLADFLLFLAAFAGVVVINAIRIRLKTSRGAAVRNCARGWLCVCTLWCVPEFDFCG